MSRLIDGLKKLSQAAPKPLGFHTSRQTGSAPTIMIIAGREIAATDATIKSIAGADAILLHTGNSGPEAKAIQKIVKPLKDTPWGVYLEEDSNEAEALTEAGCDFVVFSPASRIPAAPQDEKTGKILQVESSMDDGLLRAINDLPADAVLVTDTTENNGPLVWHQLMIYRHLAAFIAKPLIVPVPVAITEVELKALWDAGIDGVLVEAEGKDLMALKELTKKLPPRVRKQGKTEVTLLRAGALTSAIPPDEEEEEDE
jgi:hypothetical protein